MTDVAETFFVLNPLFSDSLHRSLLVSRYSTTYPAFAEHGTVGISQDSTSEADDTDSTFKFVTVNDKAKIFYMDFIDNTHNAVISMV